MPAATIVLTMLHAGGKFDGAGYKVSGGLHGVGVSVVNALSEWLELDIYVDGYHWNQRFERGQPVGELIKKEKLAKDAPTGTTVSFMADPDIFEEVVYDFRVLAQRLRETAFLNQGLRIELIDERAEGESVFFHSRAASSISSTYINAKKTRSTARSSSSRTRPRTALSRSPCSGTRRTTSPSSPSPTTSTPRRAARTSPASVALTRTINDYARKNEPAQGEGRQPHRRGRA